MNILLQQLVEYNCDEVIVADGGSTDETLEIVRSFPQVQLVTGYRGRAFQMNAGADRATGDILLFLHADSFLSENAFAHISNACEDPEISAGCFYLKFDLPSFWLKFYSLCSRINHPLFTYGDQGLFIRREIFFSEGGFKPLPLMEDLEIQQRLRKTGRFRKLSCPVTTSARRFEKNGIILQQIKNIGLVGLYLAGISPNRLAQYYS